MKKTIVKILALTLVAVMLVTVFAACGKKLSGTYEASLIGTGTCLEFKGSKVTAQFKILGAYGDPIEGKYEINDTKITITFGSDNEDAKALEGTFDFEEGEDYIKIAGIKYDKK